MLPNKLRGVPRVNDRRVLNVLRSGAPCRDLPEMFGPYTTCYNRFVRWRKAGVWSRIMDALAAANDAAVQMIDTSMVRVHQHGVCITRNRRQGELTSMAAPVCEMFRTVHGSEPAENSMAPDFRIRRLGEYRCSYMPSKILPQPSAGWSCRLSCSRNTIRPLNFVNYDVPAGDAGERNVRMGDLRQGRAEFGFVVPLRSR